MKRSLKSISTVIGIGTLLSKAFGMIRQIAIAAVFGVGSAYDAYNYAYILPGFFLVLIGGINGPLHNSIVSVLSRRSKQEGGQILYSINTSILLPLILISLILFFAADQIIQLMAPGLEVQTHKIATEQLQIMSPIVCLSGLIGTSFGSLNARNEFLLPSISPIISSLILISSVSIFGLYETQSIASAGIALKGGLILAQATLIGAIMQWAIQIPLLRKKGLLKFKLALDWGNSGVQEVWKIIIPATLSTGMLQINVFTDLFFASNIIGAASGLSYANFIVQAPLGLISNALLLPLLPLLAKLGEKKDSKDLVKRIRQGFIFSSASMICLGAIFITLSEPITKIIFGRGVFDYNAINIVKTLLIFYGIGMPVYLIRDLLVRVFYSLGDGNTPFKISTIGIVLNVILDWLFVGSSLPWGYKIPINLGASGLVLATVGVNLFTCLVLLVKLKSKVKLINLNAWFIDFLKLLFCGSISGLIAWKANYFLSQDSGFLWNLLQLLSSSTISLSSFFILSSLFKIQEVNEMTAVIKSKLIPPYFSR